MPKETRTPPWLLAMVAITLAMAVMSAGLPAVSSSELTTGRGEVRLYFDVIEESNLPTWWATTVLVLGAVVCGITAALSARGRERRRWAAMAGLVALLSLDEMTSLHERLDRVVAGRVDLGGHPFLWLVPGAVIGAVLVVTVASLVVSAPRPARTWLVTGFGLLLAAALGGELWQGALLAEGSTGPAYVVVYHAEEAGETLGAIAVLAGAVRMLDVHRRADGVLVVARADGPGGTSERSGS